MASSNTDDDRIEHAFPLERYKTHIAVIKTMTQELATPSTWDNVNAQKLREATRLMAEAQNLLERATVAMGVAHVVPEPTLIDEVREEMERRGIGNAEAAGELDPPMSRQNFWSFMTPGHAKPGKKTRARLMDWLERSRKLPDGDE